MDKNVVKRLRGICQKASIKGYDSEGKKVTLPAAIHIVCDNSLNIMDYGSGNVVWNDNEGYFVAFLNNAPGVVFNSASDGMSIGLQGALQGAAILVDYDEIQNIRVEFNRDGFKAIAGAIGMNETQRKHIEYVIFDKSNQNNAIKEKRKYSYVTQRTKSFEKNRNHTEEDERKRTFDPVAF